MLLPKEFPPIALSKEIIVFCELLNRLKSKILSSGEYENLEFQKIYQIVKF